MKCVRLTSIVFTLFVVLSAPGWAQLANPAPPNQATVTQLRPEVGATFMVPMQTRTVHLYLDGQEVTGYSTVTNGAVRYNPGGNLAAGAHRARVVAVANTGQQLDLSWSFTIVVGGLNVAPPDGTTVRGVRPEVGATFVAPVKTQTVHLYLDGQEVTGYSTVTNGQVRFDPTYDLNPGTHSARVIATMNSGRALDQSWTFTVSP